MEAATVRAKRLKAGMEADTDAAGGERSTPPLPEEIVEDILSRLPVKSLKRFRCVSQTWDAVITSAAFEHLHFERFSGGGGGGGNNRRMVFLDPWELCCPLYAWKLGGPLETIPPLNLPPRNSYQPITKSCHGLLLLRSIDNNTHYVWNPSTGEVIALPDRVPSRMAGRKPVLSLFYVAYGMGYCPASGRYKVVRMYNLGVSDELPDDDVACEVFVLGESTHWRPAATPPPPACKVLVAGSHGAVLCNGNQLYFVLRGDPDLVAFDVTSETFSTLELPLEVRLNPIVFMLTELDGCLCAYHVMEEWPSVEDPYEIWLLKDHEAGEWKKLRCIDWWSVVGTEDASLMLSCIAPLDMYYDDQTKKKKIMFGTAASKVFVVDPDVGVPEIVFSPDGIVIWEPRDSQFPTMGLFEESIVSVGPSSEEILVSSPSVLLWSEVLTYLPARTVARLNQVSKGWRAMIKSERFIHKHLHRANPSRTPRIMLTDGTPYGFRCLEDVIGTSDMPPLVDDDGGSRVVFTKPCHGLNAGSINKYDFVCNPVTKYYKAMDDHVRHDMPPSFSPKDGHVGLGFDHNVGMHVLVRLVYKKRDLATGDYELSCRMRLVDQGTWFRVEPPPSRPVADVPPVYAGGKFYWMADPELGPRPPAADGCCEIITLDLITREFQVLEGPPIYRDGSGGTTVVELGEEICVAHSKQSTDTIEIWATDGTTGSSAWSVRHRVELARFSPEYSSEEATLLSIDPCSGRILLSTGRALGYYDPTTMELETIYRLGPLVQAGKKFVPILCMDSLVEP